MIFQAYHDPLNRSAAPDTGPTYRELAAEGALPASDNPWLLGKRRSIHRVTGIRRPSSSRLALFSVLCLAACLIPVAAHARAIPSPRPSPLPPMTSSSA